MSARDAMRQMLDEMMGRDRNVDLEVREKIAIKWDDPQNCPGFLYSGTCVHERFSSTNKDLGRCDKCHDGAARIGYEAQPEANKIPIMRKHHKQIAELVRLADEVCPHIVELSFTQQVEVDVRFRNARRT